MMEVEEVGTAADLAAAAAHKVVKVDREQRVGAERARGAKGSQAIVRPKAGHVTT